MPTRSSVIFDGLNEVSLHPDDGEPEFREDGILLQTRYSCISAGTELAKLTGLQEITYPLSIGNRAIGRVTKVGADCKGFELGDLVFSHTGHTSHSRNVALLAKLPDTLDRPEAALLGMGMVAFTGVQQANVELGDVAVVTGAGLVGQFAARLLALSGATVIILDRVEGRLKAATDGGIHHAINVETSDAAQAIADLTSGKGADVVLECTGVPAVAVAAPSYCKQSGRIVLVGSPRGEHEVDVSPLLNSSHLWMPHGDLTWVGAHEWRVPLHPNPHYKHSMIRNMRILGDLLANGDLNLESLRISTYKPEDCAQAYGELQSNPDEHIAAVFDWT